MLIQRFCAKVSKWQSNSSELWKSEFKEFSGPAAASVDEDDQGTECMLNLQDLQVEQGKEDDSKEEEDQEDHDA
jgi:hypothetical protein